MFTDSTAVIKSVNPAFKSVWPDDDYYSMCMRRTLEKGSEAHTKQSFHEGTWLRPKYRFLSLLHSSDQCCFTISLVVFKFWSGSKDSGLHQTLSTCEWGLCNTFSICWTPSHACFIHRSRVYDVRKCCECHNLLNFTLQKRICYFDNCISHQNCNCWRGFIGWY